VAHGKYASARGSRRVGSGIVAVRVGSGKELKFTGWVGQDDFAYPQSQAKSYKDCTMMGHLLQDFLSLHEPPGPASSLGRPNMVSYPISYNSQTARFIT